jgi:hypothetical protein
MHQIKHESKKIEGLYKAAFEDARDNVKVTHTDGFAQIKLENKDKIV